MQYSYTKRDTKQRAKALMFSQSKVWFILAPIFFVLGVYLIIVGYVFDKTMLINGYAAIAITLMFVYLIVFAYVRYKKNIEFTFKKVGESEKIDYSIEKTETGYLYQNLLNGNKLELTQDDISTIYVQKKYIIIKLKTRILYDFPNTPEIRAILEK